MARVAIGKIAGVGIVVVVVVVALVGAAALGSGTHPTSSQTTTSSTNALRTASASGPMSIMVTRTTLDQTTADSQTGDTVYIYDLTLTGNDSSALPSGAPYFTITDGNGAVYNATNDPTVRQPLPQSTLSIGQQTEGQLAFQLPNGDQPAKLGYGAPAEGVAVSVTNLPPPSNWVSSVEGVSANLPSNSATSNYFVTASIANSIDDLYYSTDTIPVNITITPYNYDDIVGQALPDITVTSITATTLGFSVASVSPPLPVTVSVNGNLAEVDITVYVSLPSASVNVQTLELALSTT